MLDVNDTCILLTGCINPPCGVKNLVISSAEERRHQVDIAIRFFIERTTLKKIVYCDNSLAEEEPELYKLAKAYGKQLEWITFVGDDEKVVKYGKGFGEGEIIEYAINHSKILQSSSSFIKVTGRVYIKNVDRIIKVLRKNRNYFDIRYDFVDTRCFVVNRSDYSSFLMEAYKEVDDNNGRYLEKVILPKIKQNSKSFYPFPLAIDIVGVSGSTGIDYSDSRARHNGKNIRAILISILWRLKRIRE